MCHFDIKPILRIVLLSVIVILSIYISKNNKTLKGIKLYILLKYDHVNNNGKN